MTASDRRLIEDYLPLDELNAIASREKLHPRRYRALDYVPAGDCLVVWTLNRLGRSLP